MPSLQKSDPRPDVAHTSFNVQDIFFIIFKHKWKILFFTLLGVGAAAYVYATHAPIYESDAKLLVRYVLDRNMVDPVDSTVGIGRANESAIAAEVEILTSWDLSLQVAEAIGPEQLAPANRGKTSALPLAARVIQSGLWVSAPHGNVIVVDYKSENPELTTKVLQELVNRYFTKHLEVHRSAGTFDFVTQQADQVRGRLAQTEDELKRIKDKAGVISLAESMASCTAEMNRFQSSLDTSEADRAEQVARLGEIEKSLAGPKADTSPSPTASASASASTPAPAPRLASPAETQEFQAVVNRLILLRQAELDLLSKYTPNNRQVQLTHSQIAELEARRAAMAAKFPDLVGKVTSSGGSPTQQGPDLLAERTRLAAIDARIATLKAQLENTKQRAEQLANVAPQIQQLERQKELEEANYRYYAASLEKARVDEALDPSKIPNISVVQKPTAAMKTLGDLRKTLIQLAGGGLGIGLGLAFLIEMVFDQTIKRPSEFERRLHIPLLLSIPKLKHTLPARPALSLPVSTVRSSDSKAIQPLRPVKPDPWAPGHFIRPFAEAIRDRLGLYFELNNLTHKPKLVAVTGLNEGGGASTIAAGVAAALSEMGEGKVLLVDMNIGRPQVHPFFAGKPAYSLMAALQPVGALSPAAENLYLATTATASEETRPTQLGPRRLYELMPSLKASNFDYIIFDMPSFDQSSMMLSMAGLMDKVLLIAEAEKCGAGAVRRAYQELTAAQGKVACVLNKTRTYGPKLIKADV